jgi:hypothetical protein
VVVLGRDLVGHRHADLERGPDPAERGERRRHLLRGERGQQLVARPLAHHGGAVRGQPGQVVLAELAQGRRGDLVDLGEQVGAAAGSVVLDGVAGRLSVADELGEHLGQGDVVGVLKRHPGVVDRLAQFGERHRRGRGRERTSDLVVPLQGRPYLTDVNSRRCTRPPGTVRLTGATIHQNRYIDIKNVCDLCDGGKLVEAAHPPLDLVHPTLRLTQPIREYLLRHATLGPQQGHPPSHRLVVHRALPSPLRPAVRRAGAVASIKHAALRRGVHAARSVGATSEPGRSNGA